jgi:hypothetical protein
MKYSEHKPNHSLTSNAKVMNACSYTSNNHASHGHYSIKSNEISPLPLLKEDEKRHLKIIQHEPICIKMGSQAKT